MGWTLGTVCVIAWENIDGEKMMNFSIKKMSFLSFLVLISCGKKGDLVYEGNSSFPRSYPTLESVAVAPGQQKGK